jgi:hypothetical protein
VTEPQALRVAHALVPELVEAGARAVVLTGSHARGDAHADSDLDLLVLGEGPAYALELREGVLVSISWRMEQACREAFLDPRQAGSVVPGWRGAVIFHDPNGVAAALQREANDWSWSLVDTAVDRTASEWLTGLAEEVHKLAGARATGRPAMAAVNRSVLALQLGSLMALHLRILYETENVLWDLVAERLGEPWRSLQARALGLEGSFEDSCAAALALYAVAAHTLAPVLDPTQRAVVERACALAGHRPAP